MRAISFIQIRLKQHKSNVCALCGVSNPTTPITYYVFDVVVAHYVLVARVTLIVKMILVYSSIAGELECALAALLCVLCCVCIIWEFFLFSLFFVVVFAWHIDTLAQCICNC